MKKLLLILFIGIPLFSISQKLIAYRDTVADAYNFWVYVPECYDSTQATTPTVLFLHGRSLCGRNLNLVRKYGPLDAIKMGRSINAIVVAPQNPGAAWKPEKLMRIIDWTRQNYLTDTSRLYVLGMSLGGFGTLDFVGAYPEKVAAAIALCGGSTLKDYCGLNKVPLQIIHGTADKAVSVNESRRVVDKMIECGDTSLLIFQPLKGVNHSRLARVFYMPETYNWLFSHSLADSSISINREIEISLAGMELAYKNYEKDKNSFQVIDPKPDPAYTYTPPDPNAQYHIIKKGETLGHLAIMYKTTVKKLCQLNNLTEKSILQIGQKVYVK